MCAIAGIIERERDARVDQRTLTTMLAAMAHRGPDDEGIHLDGAVGLAHKRLAVIDLQTGHQPMANEDGSLWIVLNGEIYNYVELRQHLEDRHSFRTRSDTEVLLHLYEERGEGCLQALNGMFSFAIWDRRRQHLFAARDRFGIKPFYWHLDQRRLCFASEPKALIAGGLVDPRPDPQGLEEYLTFQFCLGARTLFKDVWRLEPGHYLTFAPGRDAAPRVAPYWDFSYDIEPQLGGGRGVAELRALLEDAVRLQLRSDVPVGAHLSGGIDSSTVVCLAAPRSRTPLHTFTGGFREGPAYDETRYARIVAEGVGAIHHEVWPTPGEFAARMPWLIYMMDEPAAGPGLFPQYLVSQAARDQVTVVLGGQGGDEIFGGYARYLIAYLEQCLKGAIFGTQDEGKYVVTWESVLPNLGLLQQYQPLLQRFWRDGLFDEMDRRYFRLVSRNEDTAALIAADVWNTESTARTFAGFQAVFNNPATKSYFTRMTNFDLKTLLPALLHVEDRTSMSVSLESRVPLLDHRIAELVTRLPPAVRFQGGDSKRVFREAVRDLLPPAIWSRRDKMGFPVPLTEWLRGPLRDFVGDTLLGSRARQRGLYRMDGVERLILQEQSFGRSLWGLLCLELWYRAFIDGDRPAIPPFEKGGPGGI